MRPSELRGDILQVFHAIDVDPAIGHSDHDIGAAETKRQEKLYRAVDVGERFADQILAGDAELNASRFELVHDLGGGHVDDLDAVEAFERAAIATFVTGLAQGKLRAIEHLCRLIFEPAL
jgi:glycine/D-amino acid oxidase-like deaminating enzyme